MLLFKLIQLLFQNPLVFLIFFIVLTIPLLISITIHEWAHGFVAYKFGDPTPKEQGRLSLNPFRHLDPLGTLMLFIVGIGWAKPVEINPYNIKGRYKLMLVAFAGPFSNFVMAVFFSFVVYLIISISNLKGLNPETSILALFVGLLEIIVRINLVLGLFNLIPLPPLDGANIVRNLLPEDLSEAYFRLAPYGFPILLVLIFTGGIDHIFKLAEFVQIYLLKGVALVFDPIFKMFF
jgi:Zn-dependent protease